jgi:eukaryotic-like serine/threonine-protein kinase
VIGMTIGPYQVVEKLGEGGMGEVFRARDTRLDRDVALKILPPPYATDRDRSARFEREAKTLAGLNHPHIAHVYGFEDVPGQAGVSRALIMELVPGVTLAERLGRGALPLDECVNIARQLADALDAAHESGVVHRDLKPANIKVRDDGTVKVLDFGLAKVLLPATDTHAADREQAGSNQAYAATLTSPAVTAMGVILGTAAYMSPEQARGKPVDKRADIWAFGCILYEMLTGRPPFAGETITDVIVAVVNHEPDLGKVHAPARIRTLLARCLRKDPRQRLRDVGDARLELAEPQASDEPSTRAAFSRARVAWMTFAAALILAAGLAGGAFWRELRAGDRRAVEWTGTRLGGPAVILSPRVSPDGQLVAFATPVDHLSQVAIVKPDSGNWTVLTRDRTKGLVWKVSWAPDGSRIYYDRENPRAIYSVPTLGGDERLVLEDADRPEALPDGTLLVQRINAERQPQLNRFWPGTGRLEALPAIRPIVGLEPHVRALPGGKSLAFLGRPLNANDQQEGLYEIDLDTNDVRHLGASLPIPVARLGLAPSLTVDPDDGSIIVAARDGSVHRVFKVTRAGATESLPLVMPVSIAIDAARGDGLFVSLIDRPVEILRLGPSGTTQRLAAGPNLVDRVGESFAALDDGRVLVASSAGNRRRVLVASPGKEPVPLVDTDENTRPPMTPVGDRHVALVIDSATSSDVAVVEAASGRIVERFPSPARLWSLAASADGATLYMAAAGAITAVARSGGTPRQIGSGDSIVVDPDTGDVIAKLNEQSGPRLVRIPAAGGAPQPVPFTSDLRMLANPLTPGSIKKNQLLLPLSSAASWDYHAAMVDLKTGRVTRLPMNDAADVHYLTFDADGRPLAYVLGVNTTLWRFEPRRATATR